MYSGFITQKRTLPGVGVHQRLNAAAYRLIAPYVALGFPSLRQIRHFEGVNGPDGIKTKSPGRHDPTHLYDPNTETGELITLIDTHYRGLVQALGHDDTVRAAFEAAWLAHYICDGLTPAHHASIDAQLVYYTAAPPASAARAGRAKQQPPRPARFKHAVVVPGATPADTLKRSWALWGSKGLLMTHFNFEIGIAAALMGYRIRVKLTEAQLAQARRIGPIAYFKQEARSIAALQMYERFCDSGWDAGLALQVRRRLAPQMVQTIAIVWLLAYLEAGQARITA